VKLTIEHKSYEYPFNSKMYSFMPIITVSLFSGRTQREKDRLAEAITESVCKILAVDKKEVIVVFQEAPSGNWYAEGKRL
jgi:4-oxalocrotonate tautomerase